MTFSRATYGKTQVAFSFVGVESVKGRPAGHGQALIPSPLFLFMHIAVSKSPSAIIVRSGESGGFHLCQPAAECVSGHCSTLNVFSGSVMVVEAVKGHVGRCI